VYAPTEEGDDDEKDLFYDELDRLWGLCPRHDVKIIMGDFNSKIGREEEFRPFLGNYSLHDVSNDNGIRLISFAASHDMIIGSTLFQHKNIHKATWRSPDGSYSNQIDHMLISSRYRTNLMDVKTFRGANLDSDHYLVICKLREKISLARRARKVSPMRFNCRKLNDPKVRKEFQTQLATELSVKGSNDDVDDKWKLTKDSMLSTANKLLGKEKRSIKTDWFDEECREVNENKNKAYKNMLNRRFTRKSIDEYRNARREEKKVHKRKKKAYRENQLDEVESLRTSNESRAFYRVINEGRKDFKPRTSLCKDKNGTIVNERNKILDRWVEHFDHLLNSNESSDLNLMTVNNNNDTHVNIPTLEEVQHAINKLKCNKAAGPDNIPAELLKYGGNAIVNNIWQIILSIWDKEILPSEWKLSILCPIHKKGDVLNCQNYRGISLLCVAYKIFSNILFDRLSPIVDSIIGDYQCGFRKGRSTVDQIFTLRQTLEKCREFGIETHHLFVDFKAAYDSINRTELLRTLSDFKVPSKLIKLVKLTLTETISTVRIQGELSTSFEVHNGVRQGDALACLLFNMALEKVIRDAGLNTAGTIFSKSVHILAYADDVDIIARSRATLGESFLALEKSARKMNLRVNVEKTKYMYCGKMETIPNFFEIDSFKFESVKNFTYLGSEINYQNDINPEIRKRIIAANRCFFGLRSLLKSHLIKRKTKILLYKVLIKSVLTYASETWTLTKKEEKILATFERKVLRTILGAVLDNNNWRKRYNFEIYRIFKSDDIIKSIKLSRMRWAGHIVRMSPERTTLRVFNATPSNKRPKGRPKKDGEIVWMKTLPSLK
jgi:sorting nexin-29